MSTIVDALHPTIFAIFANGNTVIEHPAHRRVPEVVEAAGKGCPGGWIFWAAINAGLDVVMSGGSMSGLSG
jgi:hypothetical protein